METITLTKEVNTLVTLTSHTPIICLESFNVSNEIAYPNPSGRMLAFSAKVVGLLVETISEDKWVIKNEIVTMKKVHNYRGVGYSKKTGWSVTLSFTVKSLG